MANCRSCGARVIFAIVQGSGKWIPLEPDVRGDGSYVRVGLRDTHRGPKLLVRPLGGEQLPLDEGMSAERYMPHHATCPDAEKWKR